MDCNRLMLPIICLFVGDLRDYLKTSRHFSVRIRKMRCIVPPVNRVNSFRYVPVNDTMQKPGLLHGHEYTGTVVARAEKG